MPEIAMPVDDEMTPDEERREAILARAYALRAYLDELATGLTDEDVAEHVDMLPLWNPGQRYDAGDRVRWGEDAYEVIQAHQAQLDWPPDAVPALYRHIVIEGIPEWVQPTGAHDAYNRGDKVKHNGGTWESLIDGNVWEPTPAVSNLWAQVD